MNEINYLPIKDVKIKGNMVKVINYRPTSSILVCVVAGAIIMFIPQLLGKILGLFFIVMGLIVFFVIKDHKVADIYNEGILIYGDLNASKAYFLDYDQIKQWRVNRINNDEIIEFDTIDGKRIPLPTYQTNKAYGALYKIIFEKEEKYMKAQEAKEKQLSIPESINNLKNRFLNKLHHNDDENK